MMGSQRLIFLQRNELFFFYEIVTLCRPPPHQDWKQARAAGKPFACDDKELGPQLGEAITRRADS